MCATACLAALLLAAAAPAPAPPPRPADLMQASRCPAEAATLQAPIDPVLRPIETAPPCLAAIFAELAAAAARIAGPEAETILLSVKVARGFSQSVLLHGLAADPTIHYATDLDPILTIISTEWDHYRSPDGDLGWSGFLLVAREGGAEVRSIDAHSLASFYDETVRLESEFFPGKTVVAQPQ